MVQYAFIIKSVSVVVLVVSIFTIRLFFNPKDLKQQIQFYEMQFTDFLKSEYEMYYSIAFDDEDGDIDEIGSDIDLTMEQIKNQNHYKQQQKGLIESCNSKIFRYFNSSSQTPDQIKIYLDWDDQFNNIESVFNYKQPLDNSSLYNSSSQTQFQLKLNDTLLLQIIEEISNETDILFTQHSIKQGRYDFISSLCYNQVFNHIPGSNFLFGKLSLNNLQKISTKKHRFNVNCFLEIDFYPRIFDLRDDCISFQEYVNIQHLKENDQVFYVSIQGIYKPNYDIFSLNSYKNTSQNSKSGNRIYKNNQPNKIFSCMRFWVNNQKYQGQQYLVQEINMNQNIKQGNTTIQYDKYENYLLRVNFLISSTKPLIVYCQNSDLIFLKCQINHKCNKRIKSNEFFQQYQSLNQDIILKKIFKIITHTILAVKSQILHDSRVFELFTAEFSIQQKQTILLEEIHQFSTIYKQQETGYDIIQKKFLKESFDIISQQYSNKINKFHNILSSKVVNQEEDILKQLKAEDKNDLVFKQSNFTEIIINENLTGNKAYKYISQSCYS